MKFNIEKCTVIHLGYKYKHQTYSTYDPVQQIRTNIKSTYSETDLGVNNLLFSK